ncbi:hypothetical protein Q0Z83_075550 [Actinoplanes sichuanensis]|nr:hypothetical protein Q0Z83_075550 [Actinoplanes sichuanensis]
MCATNPYVPSATAEPFPTPIAGTLPASNVVSVAADNPAASPRLLDVIHFSL